MPISHNIVINQMLWLIHWFNFKYFIMVLRYYKHIQIIGIGIRFFENHIFPAEFVNGFWKYKIQSDVIIGFNMISWKS
jgi:hypothetical protein